MRKKTLIKKIAKIILAATLLVLFVASQRFIYQEGKADMISELQEQQKASASSAHVFSFVANQKEFMRYTEDGRFYVEGRHVIDDKEVYAAFKNFVVNGCEK